MPNNVISWNIVKTKWSPVQPVESTVIERESAHSWHITSRKTYQNRAMTTLRYGNHITIAKVKSLAIWLFVNNDISVVDINVLWRFLDIHQVSMHVKLEHIVYKRYESV